MTNPLIEKLKKNSTIKNTSVISQSKIYSQAEAVSTDYPIINLALSGSVLGGVLPGLMVLAGPSKHFKSMFGLLLASAYMKTFDDAVLLFYDSEFGTPKAYFDTFGIDMDRVIHTGITDIEELKVDIMNQLSNLDKKDKVFILIDSIGNLASKKEVEDALEGKSVADMTRAKALKSLFRMVTPHLTMKDIPMVAINHTYKTLELYSKDVVGGGTGIYYSAHTIWIIGRQQEKDKKEGLLGWNFIINVEKSRYVKEKSKFPVTVLFNSGIYRWSGLLLPAISLGYIAKVPYKNSFKYSIIDRKTGEISEEAYSEDKIPDSVWEHLINKTDFPSDLDKSYTLGNISLLEESEEIDDSEFQE